MKALVLIMTLLATTTAAQAADLLIRKTSPHSVDQTMDQLVAAVEGAGATVFARVNHAAGAASVDLELPATQALIFGNPQLGTAVMQADQTAGLDLPMRVVVFDDNGQTTVAYHAPARLAKDHNVPADAEVLAKITGALDKLTGAAIAE